MVSLKHQFGWEPFGGFARVSTSLLGGSSNDCPRIIGSSFDDQGSRGSSFDGSQIKIQNQLPRYSHLQVKFGLDS
jgi:hypothetical protein